MMSRIDATAGAWRAPAGLPAVMANAVSLEVKFTDTDQGELNYNNINVIRPVTGAGICVMGGRTRKLYGPDRYVSTRRTLIFIKETLKLSHSMGGVPEQRRSPVVVAPSDGREPS